MKLASTRANQTEVVCKIGNPDYDPSICVKPKLYCSGLKSLLKPRCLETGVLELFTYDNETLYDELTTEEILDRINEDDLKR